MATNNFLPFCPTDTATNLLTQVEYAADADRTIGNQPGVARSKLVNKAIRQSAFITSQVAQFAADKTGANVLDDADTAKLLGILNSAFTRISPIVTKYITGSSNHNLSFIFMIATGSATVGATYTNNSVTFTVSKTVASGTQIIMTGNGAPTVSGTLTKASGTGDATLVFYAMRAPLYIRGRLAGGGGGGGGGGLTPTAGTSGNNTTLGSTLFVANAGGGGPSGVGPGGTGGSASLGTGVTGTALPGGAGQGGTTVADASTYACGGAGGMNNFGGAGAGSLSGVGGDGATNTGAGGAGGGATNAASAYAANGGGAGGFVDATLEITSTFVFAYVVGSGGTFGTGSTSGSNGGTGATGYVEITEYYQ